MDYTTTREIFDPFTNDELGNFGAYKSYKIFEGNNLAGEFFFKNITSFFSFSNEVFYIEPESKLFPKKYFLANKITGEPLAEFKTSFLRRLVYNEIGKVNFKQQSYTCTHTKPIVVKSSFFSSESVVTINFLLQNENDVIRYYATYKVLSDGESNNYRPDKDCVIEIYAANDDFVLLCSGLFLIENFFST